MADRLRWANTLARTEGALGGLLQTRCRFVVTEVGGCAIDVDTEQEYDTVKERFAEWTASQKARAKALHGELRESVDKAGSGA